MVERKSGYAVIAKVSNKTSDLVGAAIIKALKPFQARVKTLTYDNGKEFCGHANIDQALGSTGTARSAEGELVLVVGLSFLMDGCRGVVKLAA